MGTHCGSFLLLSQPLFQACNYTYPSFVFKSKVTRVSRRESFSITLKMDNIREKLKRRLSHKDQAANFDEHDSADEETMDYVTKEADDAEKEGHDTGKPGSFLNRLITHGNKKTEEQLAREAAARNAQAGSADRVVTQR